MTMLYGADVDELRRLAKQFDDGEARLRSALNSLDGPLRSSPWSGPAADRFRSDWTSQHSRSLAAAANLLGEAAVALRRNADQQQSASAVAASSSAASIYSAPTTGGVDWTQLPPDMWRNLTQLVDSVTTTEYSGVKPWEMLSLLNKAAELNGVGSKFFSFFSTAFGAVTLTDHVLSGDPAVPYDVAHLVADGLTNSRVPEVMLAGLAVHTWTEVAQQASVADFSSAGINKVTSYIAENPGEALEVVGESVVDFGQKFVGWLPIPL